LLLTPTPSPPQAAVQATRSVLACLLQLQ